MTSLAVDFDTQFMPQFSNVSQRQREPLIHTACLAENLRAGYERLNGLYFAIWRLYFTVVAA
jgi:hypothetical protein